MVWGNGKTIKPFVPAMDGQLNLFLFQISPFAFCADVSSFFVFAIANEALSAAIVLNSFQYAALLFHVAKNVTDGSCLKFDFYK